MGYELLGRIVWFVGKRYLRRRYGDRPGQVAAGVIVLAAVAGIVVAGRRQAADEL